ncbi:MAG TPA: ABC transporter permease [Acidimicrobiales bacterium]|nr:ABC transporter permease [Acidimicrobiales bacterium]
MVTSVARRLVSMLVTLFGVSVIIFVVLRLLPGNAVTASLGVSAGLLSHAQLIALDRYYGVGEPFFRQFGSWLGAMFTGNLGVSLSSRTSVASLIGAAFPVTFELAIVSMIIGELIGVLFGVFGSLRPGHAVDSVGQGVAVVGLGVPSFVIGTFLVTFLASVFHYFPSSEGFVNFTQDPWLNLQQIFFPALTLGIGIGAALMRTTRAAMLEVSGLNYARTARGKGLSKRLVTWKHLFLGALVPVLTMSGIQFGYLLGGTVVVEEIFVLPGLGRLLITAINNRDFPVVQSVTLIFATGFIVVNMLTDVLYTVIDPRTRQA